MYVYDDGEKNNSIISKLNFRGFVFCYFNLIINKKIKSSVDLFIYILIIIITIGKINNMKNLKISLTGEQPEPISTDLNETWTDGRSI